MKDYVSLETAKKLQDAGIKIDTAMVWAKDIHKNIWTLCPKDKVHLFVFAYEKCETIPAPSIAEMLEWLPSDFDGFPLTIRKNNKLWEVGYINRFNTGECIFDLFTHKTPQEALAQLCLWVREEGYLK